MGYTLLDKYAWGIMAMPTKPSRFCIYNTQTGKIIDDMQGAGFSNEERAYNYGKNKFHSNGMCNIADTNVTKPLL